MASSTLDMMESNLGLPTTVNNGSPPTTNANDQLKSKLSWLRRPCLWVALCIKWLPVLFISAVIGWSYFAFVVQLSVKTVDSLTEKIVFLSIYHLILVLFVSSYYKTIFAPPCIAPSNWKLSPAMTERLSKARSEDDWKHLLELFVVEMQLPVQQRSVQGAIRYCDKCQAVKPDRSHHCSICGQCVLKMDHHCPWVNNCVAFNNYKFFMLFLGYALIYCIFIAACVFKYFLLFWTDGLESSGTGKFHILFLFFVSVMFCISVSSLFWYHVYLILNNRSTLEQFRAPYFSSGPDENGWSLGKRNNFQEVFGDEWYLWFLPLHTAIGDGLTYPTRLPLNVESNYQSIQQQQQPLASRETLSYVDDEVNYPTAHLNGNKKKTEVVLMDGNSDKVSVKVSEHTSSSNLMHLQ